MLVRFIQCLPCALVELCLLVVLHHRCTWNSKPTWIFGLTLTFNFAGSLVLVETSLMVCQSSYIFRLTFKGVNFLPALDGLMGHENSFCKPKFFIKSSSISTWSSLPIVTLTCKGLEHFTGYSPFPLLCICCHWNSLL